MQSGKAKTKRWVLEYDKQTKRFNDLLMGWVGTEETLQQVRLTFDSCEEAIRYAEHAGLNYKIYEPKKRTPVIKTYADNFTKPVAG